MPTHGDYPWERDERKRTQESGRRQPPRPPMPRAAAHGAAPPPPRSRATPQRRFHLGHALLLLLAACLVMVAVFRAMEPPVDPPLRGPTRIDFSQAQPRPSQPQPRTARNTFKGRLPTPARRPISWPMRMKSRFVGRGVLEVWGSTPAPDGATISVHVRRSAGGRWFKLGDAPVAKGHFLLRQTLTQGLQGERIRVRARFG